MLVKNVKELISDKEFSHCTDAILSIILDKPRTEINNEDFISDTDAKQCEKMADDFKNSYPIIYQRKRMYFMDVPLIITEDVFPPVFATEPFMKEILDKFSEKKDVLEIGTGSGAMAIVLAKRMKANIIATDISSKALNIAKENAKLNNVNIKFVESNLYEKINGKFDLIISNPPQQKTETINLLEKEGKMITPRVASDGGKDGFELYNAIRDNAKKYLKPNGVLVLQYDGYTNIYKEEEL